MVTFSYLLKTASCNMHPDARFRCARNLVPGLGRCVSVCLHRVLRHLFTSAQILCRARYDRRPERRRRVQSAVSYGNATPVVATLGVGLRRSLRVA